MARPSLEELTVKLDRDCITVLGENIEYAADGATFVGVQGYVDYRDADKAFEGAEVISQDITVSVLKADVPVKPIGSVRVKLARKTERLFAPRNARTDATGTHWEFEVVEVPGG